DVERGPVLDWRRQYISDAASAVLQIAREEAEEIDVLRGAATWPDPELGHQPAARYERAGLRRARPATQDPVQQVPPEDVFRRHARTSRQRQEPIRDLVHGLTLAARTPARRSTRHRRRRCCRRWCTREGGWCRRNRRRADRIAAPRRSPR